MAPEKTKALLVSYRRSFQYPKIVHEKDEVVWKKSIKYLGVELDWRLSFGEHLHIATAKAIQCGANLTRLMPNIGRPRKAKRRLVVEPLVGQWVLSTHWGLHPQSRVLGGSNCRAGGGRNNFALIAGLMPQLR